MMNRDEIREHLRGPVTSVRTPFQRDGSIDLAGLRCFIDFCIDAGSQTIILTWGDSHFLCLSEAEIAELTKVTIEHVAKRAMVVSADRTFNTRQAVDFASYCKEAGSDIHMCSPPDWGASCTAEGLAEHYQRVAEILPVMIITNLFDGRDALGLETIRLALQKSDNIVAIKDDLGGSIAQQMCLLAGDQCVIMAGGTKQLHLNMLPFGCESYMSTYLWFYPEIAHRYWTAIESNDIRTAWDIANRYDQPYYQFTSALPGGFDAGVHGTLELFGICERWRRKPYHSLTDPELEGLAEFFRGLSIL
jgi:4-hydroxy-tetrahydrodipicolinate synthase